MDDNSVIKKGNFWIDGLLWGLFLIGILEIMAWMIFREDIRSYLLLSVLLGISVLITAFKTFQPKIGYYHELSPYLVHPLFLCLGIVAFLLFNPEPLLQQVAIVLTVLSFMVVFSENFSDLTHKIHDAVKFLIIFFLYNAIFETVHFFKLNHLFLLFLFTLATFLFLLHVMWRLKNHEEKLLLLSFILAVGIGVLSYFLYSYYTFASFLILAIIVLDVYYVCWGIIHHLAQKNLKFSLLIEYVLISGLVLSMFFSLLITR